MPTFTKHISLADLTEVASRIDPAAETPIVRATAEARLKEFETICCPLTTEKWKTRWQEMCLLPADDIEDKEPLERRAEEWRSKPAFMRDEVTVTRLGGQTCRSRHTCRTKYVF